MTKLPRLGLGLAFVALAAGCGGAERALEQALTPRPEPAGRPAAVRSSPACAPGSVRSLRTKRLAHGAIVRRPTTAYRRPGGASLGRFGLRNANDVPTVFGALAEVRGADCEARWYRVKLPRKPNGVVGYVRAADVELFPVRTRIVVDVSERRVTLYRSGRQVLSATAAVGSAATPTPTGSFYVDQRLVPYDPTGPFGPGAVGIAAYSEVLTGWAQGGPIAIHGTNAPASIGKPVSNGCVRLPNDVLRRVFDAVLPGTPVLVRA